MKNKPRVLFLCTGNSARSQMAEAFLRKYAGDYLEVHSAGITPQGIHPYTIQVMWESGMDISDQKSKSVNEYTGKQKFDYLITVCDDADRNCPVSLLPAEHRLHWSFEDPAKTVGPDDQVLAKFRQVRNQIEARIRDWLLEQEFPK